MSITTQSTSPRNGLVPMKTPPARVPAGVLWQSEYNELKLCMQQMNRQQEEARKTMEVVVSSLNTHRQLLLAKDDEIEALTKRVTILETELETQAKTNKAELAVRDEKIVELEEKVEELEEKAEELEENDEELDKKIDEVNERHDGHTHKYWGRRENKRQTNGPNK